jgi:hypothetical protein
MHERISDCGRVHANIGTGPVCQTAGADAVTNFMLRATAAPWWRGVEFLLMHKQATLSDSRGAVYHWRMTEGEAWDVPPVMSAEQTDDFIQTAPTFRMDYEDAQTLMDDLWKSGLRPTEGAGSAGALAAVQEHRDDLRKIVFKKLEIE